MILVKRLITTISIHSLLFILLIIGIQNSTNKKSVNFLINETIELPIGFIAGTSFLAGSLLGGILTSISMKND
tara:strand:+ start:80 stop:298 length:219 start_codon:yes stop_codon:yes gene_type:complete